MGIPYTSSVLDLIQKVRSWIPGVGGETLITSSGDRMCWECKTRCFVDFSECLCERCGRILCGKCLKEHAKLCKFCIQDSSIGHGRRGDGEYDERIIDRSPRTSPECEGVVSRDNIKQFQSHHLARFLEAQRYGGSSNSSVASSTGHPSPVSFRRSSSRSDDEDGEDSGKHFFSPSSEYCRDISDVDSSSISTRHEFYSFKSMSSSPLDSPSKMSRTPTTGNLSVQQEQEESHSHLSLHQTMAVLRRPGMETEDLENTDDGSDDLSIFRDRCVKVHQPLDFENDGHIWFPPPPEVEQDEMENNFFESDDDDGDSCTTFSTSSFSTSIFPDKDKANEEHKEPLRAAVRGHFRALVSQLLRGEGICAGNEGWLDIVTSVAWQAAKFVKPDTRRGGSMDPGHYVKVKCIAAGAPCESTLIKGVVCTKNIKHKRMTSQYKNPKLFLLGGALEYQRTPNKLASFDTLLQQEMDHLKLIVSKIEAHRPNVLLVEKSVSSYAQEYLLTKEISLVLNVKRPLLERIARCTGAHIVPSVDNLSATRLGHCEIFRLERFSEKCGVAHQPNKKSAKTLMFFEGCPRRLGCTVLLRGASREVLKKVKHVVQYAVFAAYHLSLETSFLADEGASLPEIPLKPSVSIPKRLNDPEGAVPAIPYLALPSQFLPVAVQPQDSCDRNTSCFYPTSDALVPNAEIMSMSRELRDEPSDGHFNPVVSPGYLDTAVGREPGASNVNREGQTDSQTHCKGWTNFSVFPSANEILETSSKENTGKTFGSHGETAEDQELARADGIDGNESSKECFSTVDNHQSILVSFSSRCVLKGTVCERSQLLRITFYGSFDKPLGRYLQDDLFNQTSYCGSCKERTDAHIRCYTHQQGNLTINVRCLPSVVLPGERDGKIWMWHRCLKCAQINGVPPATRRVIMSDAAWGLSFGKFLELSFSDHATANRLATCGHSLQRDCLRYYGFGGMVAFFRYSPIDILSVRLPPSMLEFNGPVRLEWVKKEAVELSNKMEVLYAEAFDALHNIEQKGLSLRPKQTEEGEFHNHVADLKVLLKTERNEYENLLQPVGIENSHYFETKMDILGLNRLRRCLLIDSYIWDHRLYSLDSLLKISNLTSKYDSHMLEAATYVKLKEWRDDSFYANGKLGRFYEENKLISSAMSRKPKEEPNLPYLAPVLNELTIDDTVIQSGEKGCLRDMESVLTNRCKCDELNHDEEALVAEPFLESTPFPASNLSDKIDSAWTGTGQPPARVHAAHALQPNGHQAGPVGLFIQKDNPASRRLKSPMRVYSFDSAMRIQEKIRRGSSTTSLQLSSLRSFHASGDYRSMVRDPIPEILRNFSQTMPKETRKLNSIFSSMPLFIPSASRIAGDGFQILLPQTNCSDMVIPVYDNEPTSIIAYVLGSNDYRNWIANKFEEHEGGWNGSDSNNREDVLGNLSGFYNSTSSTFSAWQSRGSLDVEDAIFRHGEDASATIGLFLDPKRSHFRVSFGDESPFPAGKVKFSVICYFARQFESLRHFCCPSEVDFISSLSRCSRWNAQGGKSNVYFAKSFDERFIVKQVTKTELDSFEEFAPEYFKYLADSLSSGSPTCLAKVLGIYQVTVKHLKGGRELKMDLMVMENLFFGRSISRVYDLKGSARSRYNPDTTGKNKVLLDMNLLETLCTNPLFLSGRAKRSLERAVWNDTSFLASVDVMDYSLLVGVDEERKELVLGIIDFMRQYTWDKHLETWVKASGILGGPKNTSPTVISPKQYKKRFRKAMSTYFLTVPDQWSQ